LIGQVRREKIGERMKFLQDLVPGCNKVIAYENTSLLVLIILREKYAEF